MPPEFEDCMNILGQNLVFTSFGESHGKAIGGVLDGVPAGVRINLDMIREALDKRAGRAYPQPLPKRRGEGASQRATLNPQRREDLYRNGTNGRMME